MKQKSKSKNQKAKIQIKYQKFFLVIIIALGLALRLVNLQQWFQFEFDEEVIAWKLRPFLQEGKPFLIGGGTPFGFHLGPGFYYLSAIPLFFSHLDPIGWGVAAAIFGTVTIWLTWLVGKNLYGRRVGLVAALLWATSFTAVMSDRHWWPLVLDPALSLLVMYFLFNILNTGIAASRRPSGLAMTGWIGLGLTLAFGWQADLSVLPLFLATAVVAVRSWREHKKGVILAIAILLVSVLPLVLFELRHPGANLGRLRSDLPRSDLLRSDLLKLTGDRVTEAAVFVPAALGRLLFPITHLDGNLWKFYSWCKGIADGRVAGQPWWATGVTVFLLLIPFISYKLNVKKFAKLFTSREVSQTSHSEADKILRLMIISTVGGLLLFKLFGGNLYDFYLAVLYPVVILLAAKSIDFIWRKWGILAGGAIILLIVGLNLTSVVRAYHPQSLAIKQQAVAWAAEQLKGRDFELDSLSGCSRYNGVRYLFFLENMEPAKSFIDQDLSWLYPSHNEQFRPEYLVTFVTYNDLTESDRERYDQLQTLSVAVKRFGDLEVLIQESPGRAARRLLINRR